MIAYIFLYCNPYFSIFFRNFNVFLLLDISGLQSFFCCSFTRRPFSFCKFFQLFLQKIFVIRNIHIFPSYNSIANVPYYNTGAKISSILSGTGRFLFRKEEFPCCMFYLLPPQFSVWATLPTPISPHRIIPTRSNCVSSYYNVSFLLSHSPFSSSHKPMDNHPWVYDASPQSYVARTHKKRYNIVTICRHTTNIWNRQAATIQNQRFM